MTNFMHTRVLTSVTAMKLNLWKTTCNNKAQVISEHSCIILYSTIFLSPYPLSCLKISAMIDFTNTISHPFLRIEANQNSFGILVLSPNTVS